jgi:hypothetical protein
LLGGTATVHTFAASGFSTTGTQQIVTNAGVVVRNEQAQTVSVVATANSPALLPALTVPVPFVSGTTGTVWMAVMADCDGIDASTNCDSGVCSAFLEQTYALDLHGGQCCIAGGGYCTGAEAGLSTTYAIVNVNTAPDAGNPATGVSLQVSCTGSTGAITATAWAGPNSGCNFYGLTSEWQSPPPH